MEWPLVRRMVRLARKIHPSCALTLQTNSLLLDASRIRFLKKNDVAVEPGIDGDLAVNYSHRHGIEQKRYGLLLNNIQLLVRSGIRMNPTMTVHPAEAGKMPANFSWLVEQGLSMIDVHPAFLAPWSEASANLFMQGYRSILAMEQRSRRYLVCRDYSSPIGRSFDLVVLPDGRVLPNWTYLTFPREVRDRFFIMQLTARGLRLEEGLAAYLKDLDGFFSAGERTYRDLSNFNAARALMLDHRVSVQRRFRVYEALCREVQSCDRSFKMGGTLIARNDP